MNRHDRRRQISSLSKAPDADARLAADMRVATGLHKDGRLKEAADLYRKILKAYEGHPELRVTWSNLGAAYQGLGKLDEAVQALKKARALKPDAPAAYQNLGMAHLQLNQLPEALACLETAVELAPAFMDGWMSLGIARDRADDLPGALEAFERACDLAPEAPQPRFNLALLHRRAGRLDEARAALARCVEIEPRFAEALYTMGSIEEQGGDLRAAAGRYLETLRLLPQAEPIHAQLGGVLHALARTDAETAKTMARSWAEEFPASLTARNNAAILLGTGLISATPSVV